jgi:hypothetical protein
MSFIFLAFTCHAGTPLRQRLFQGSAKQAIAVDWSRRLVSTAVVRSR